MLDPQVSAESSGASYDSSPNATALAAVDGAARAIAGVGDLEDVLQLVVDRQAAAFVAMHRPDGG
jgi:hypothetical protein